MPIKAILNSDGQLVSDVDLLQNPDTAPINVNGNSNLVDDLNADTVDGLHSESFLRTDDNSTVAVNKTLTVNGKVVVNSTPINIGEFNLKPGGILRIGWFEIKTVGNLMYFEYSPQEYLL